WALGVLKEFAGMTAKSTSPLGIALMVAEFTVCMATEQPEPTPGGDPTNPEYPNDPEPPLPGGSGLGAIPGAGSVQFAYGESHSRMENIIRGHEPALFTHIYYDGTQHYYDVHLICLLPDGYYSSNYTTVYKIQGGI